MMMVSSGLSTKLIDTHESGRANVSESDLLYHELTRIIIGAFFQVHRDLGFGFLEKVYVNALCVLLRHLGLKVEREVSYEIIYQGESVGTYRADVVVEGKVIIEGCTGRQIEPSYLARMRNYLRASKLNVGLLLH